MRILLFPLALAGCADTAETEPFVHHSGHSGLTTPPTLTTTGEPDGACGEVTVWAVTLGGTVLGRDGNPAVGAEVWVEDRGWEPGTILGQATTDAYGAFEVSLAEVTSVEDCWATLLDYVLVGTLPGQRGEKDINIELFNAIDGETFEADLGAFPLRLEATK